MIKPKKEEGKGDHKNPVPSTLKRGVSLRSTHGATYRGSVEDTGYRIDYNSERLGVSHIIGQKSRLSGVAPPRPKGNPFEEAEYEEAEDEEAEEEEDDLDEPVAGLSGNMNSGMGYPGGPGARGRGMVGGGRGRGVPGGTVSGRNGLSPQIPIPMYNPVTGPVPQAYQQQGGAQRFPPGPPNAPFGGVGSTRPQQMGGGMFAPGRGTVAQNPRRSSVPMPGPGRGGMGNTPSYNSSPTRLPLPSPPRPLTQMVLPVSTVASQGYNNSTYRQQKILETIRQQQEEDDRKRDAMREQCLQPPASTYSNVSSREGSLLNEPSSNSSNLSLPYASTPAFQGPDRRSSVSSGTTSSSVYSRKAREEVFRRQQEEEEIFRRQREEDERRELLARDSETPQHLRGLPTSPTTPGSPGATGAAFPPGHVEHQPETARSEPTLPELEISPAGITTTPGRRSSHPLDRPGTATTVVSLPELGSRADPGTPPRRRPSSQSWSGPDRTDSIGIDRVAARRKPVPKPLENSDTPPTSPVSKVSTNGTGRKPLQYTGPVGPWFPTLPTPIDDAKSPPLPPPTELPGLAATKPNTHCISDDIIRRPSVARGYRFNEEHEAQCLSDDIQNGSLLAGEKGILPPEFFDRHRTACASDDLAKIYSGLGEEDEQKLQSQMEHQQRLREAIRERACLGDELSEWHIDRSGLIPVIEEEEGEAPTHAQRYTAGIPVVVEADARRISRSKLFNNPGHLDRKPPPPPKPPKVPLAPPKVPESPPPSPEDEVPPPQARWEMSWEYY